MKVRDLHITDFRCIREMHLEFDEYINVFVGNNGHGKTAILDVLAVMLSRLIGRIRSTRGTGRFFSLQDIRIGATKTINEISVTINNNQVSWRVSRWKWPGAAKQKITNQDELRAIAKDIQLQLIDNPEMNIPIAVYYAVNRAVIDVPLRIRRKHEFDQLSAYDLALTGERSDFRLFFEWYRDQEDYENQRRSYPVGEEDKYRQPDLLKELEYIDPQLDAVRRAICKLTGFKHVRIQRKPLRMELKKGETYFDIRQLSDGEKCLIAMIGDLARRLAIANPELEDPLYGEGVVLIDEIDLHMHPEWQRKIIPKLRETFPKCQFIVSTHSPQIIAEVKPESIFMLNSISETEVTFTKPNESYGKNTDSILEDIMGVTARPYEIDKKLKDLFMLIQSGRLQQAEEKIKDLRKKIGEDGDIMKAEVLIKRQEILGK